MIDIQGHRGCRALMPENTIPAFKKAIVLGVSTLELDVVISKDKKVVVSHEPYLSSEICLDLENKPIPKGKEKSYNLFQMNYDEIKKYDCGSKIHPRFPSQKKLKTYKPLLSEAIDFAENYTKEKNLKPIFYNIETKCLPEGDEIFHPKPKEFVELLMAVLKEKDILNRSIIQSFDVRTLKIIHQKFPKIKLALLVENNFSLEENLNRLGFLPDIYSPDFNLITKELVNKLKSKQIKLIPWTINEKADILKMLDYQVDGIISDYPDRVIELTKNLPQTPERG